MVLSTYDVITSLQEHTERAREVVSHCESVRSAATTRIAEVEAELEPALRGLAEVYLPTLTADAIAEVTVRTGFSLFRNRDPLKVVEHREQVLRRRIAQIEADPSYTRRTYLVGPYGELTRALEEARSLLEPWAQACAQYEQHEGFTELIDLNYDTPEFAVRWWEPRYWRLWATGDRITEALGAKDFGDDVLPKWREVEGHRRRWREQVAQVQAQIDAVHALVKEHDDGVDILPRLSEVVLQESQTLLMGYLKQADLGLLEEWNQKGRAPDPAVTMGLRKVSGMMAKIVIFREIEGQGLAEIEAAMKQRIEGWRRKIQKLRRPKKAHLRWPVEASDPGFPEKAARINEMLDKHDKLLGKIFAYNDYGSFQLDNDPNLWYAAFTGGARPGRLLPTTRSWYERHPDVVVLRDDPIDTAAVLVAAAVLATDHHDVGYLS